MSELYFGFFEADITPTEAHSLEGYEYRHERGSGNSGVLDHLFAKALCLHLDGEELLIITLDLCILTVQQAHEITQEISKTLGVSHDVIMLCCSHTHSGPVTCNPWNDNDLEEKELVAHYFLSIKKTILSVVSEARCRKHECEVSYATAVGRFGYNRRVVQVDKQDIKSVKMLFSRWENQELKPNGPVDLEIPILIIERINKINTPLQPFGQERIILFSVPYHPVVLGKHSRVISADYPGALCRCIEDSLGDGTKTMFLLGASGDTQPMIATQESPKAIEIVGKAIGSTILLSLADKTKISSDTIKSFKVSIDIVKDLNEPIIVQILKIGACTILGISGECFVDIGMRIKESYQGKQLLISTNTNGWVGYLPTEAAFEEKGYEVELAIKKGYSADKIHLLTETLKELLQI